MVLLGLDFGTTFSTVAMATSSELVILKQSNSSYIPTCLFLHADPNSVSYGYDAEYLAASGGPGSFYKDLKRWVDCTEKNYQSYLHKLSPSYKVIVKEFGAKSMPVPYISPLNNDLGLSVALPSLIALYTKSILSDAERVFNVSCTGVICSVPAGYNTLQRAFTQQSVSLSGYSCVYIINEPSAAAYSTLPKLSSADKYLAVYDFGGGTFDVSIVSVRLPTFAVRSSGGDMNLGGRDIDRKLSDKIYELADFLPQKELNVSSLKEALSLQTDPVKYTVTNYGISETVSIDQTTLREIASVFITRTVDILTQVKVKSSVPESQSLKLVVVGGSSYLPGLLDTLETVPFVSGIIPVEDARTAVARGCALYSECLDGRSKALLIDCITHHLSVTTFSADSVVVAAAGSPIPFEGERKLTLRKCVSTSNYQARMFEGDYEKVFRNERIYAASVSLFTLGVNWRLPNDVEMTLVTRVDSMGKVEFYPKGPSGELVNVQGTSHYDYVGMPRPTRKLLRLSDYNVNSAALVLALTLTREKREKFLLRTLFDALLADLRKTASLSEYSKKYPITRNDVDVVSSRMGIVVSKVLRGSDLERIPL
uniref:p65 protein n=1 Tax=Citrus tristeza virus TaxID=12162 RepID=B9VB24_9CLOS|nr:p65 protein [Citrus tristeza virus]